MELGSEYNLSLTDLNLVSDSVFDFLSDFSEVYKFDSGRSALRHIASRLTPLDEVLLPEFICESVSNCFIHSKINFYKLNEDFSIDIADLNRKLSSSTKVIFLMHFFGTLQPVSILSSLRTIANDNGCIIIEDTTHSVFSSKTTIGDYMICSIRKWMPVSKGGLLYYNQNKLDVSQPNYSKSIDNNRSYAMILKTLFLKQGLDVNGEYREIFVKSENDLDNQKEILMMSDFSTFVARCNSIDVLTERRKRNYEMLYKALNERGVKPAIELYPDEIPFTFPMRVRDRDALREYLIDNRIYCAVHWPFDELQRENRMFAVKNSRELISLPIDQRYDDKHITYLIEVLSKYGGDLLY